MLLPQRPGEAAQSWGFCNHGQACLAASRRALHRTGRRRGRAGDGRHRATPGVHSRDLGPLARRGEAERPPAMAAGPCHPDGHTCSECSLAFRKRISAAGQRLQNGPLRVHTEGLSSIPLLPACMSLAHVGKGSWACLGTRRWHRPIVTFSGSLGTCVFPPQSRPPSPVRLTPPATTGAVHRTSVYTFKFSGA